MSNTLHLRDDLKAEDKLSKKNRIDVFNSAGEHILRGYNIVVDTGRLFSLKNSFQIAGGDLTIGRNNIPLQWASCFSVGDGAAPPNDLSNPSSPLLSDTALANLTPFYAADPARLNEDADIAKPLYWNATDIKDFTNISLVDDGLGDIYVECTLTIGYSECAGKNINELCLYLATHTVVAEEVTNKANFLMFSRITFPSLPNAVDPNTDEYTIIYRVYA